MRLYVLIISLLLLTANGVKAQRTVTGTVTDTKGEPLYGVTIAVKSGKHTVVT